MKRRDFLCGLSGLAAGLAFSEIKSNSTKKKSVNPSAEAYRSVCPDIKDLHIMVASHCNYSCKGCITFSPVAKEEFTTYEDFYRDFSILKDLIADKLENLAFMGGEPTLNPDLFKIMQKCAEWFPNAQTGLNTNGSLLHTYGDDFWELARDMNLIIFLSYYPVNFDRTFIEKKIEKYGLKKYQFYIPSKKLYDINTRKVINENYNFKGTHPWSKHIVDLDGSIDYIERRYNCKHRIFNSYARGNIYHCDFHSTICAFKDYFNLDIEITEKDYIKVTDIKNKKQLEDFVLSPKPLCRYCKQCHAICYGAKEEEWEFSKRELSEWAYLN